MTEISGRSSSEGWSGSVEWFAAAIAIALFAVCLLVASKQYFWGDDFAYLAKVRGGFTAAPWSWLDVFLPQRPGFNWAYRPLSLETFFYLGNRAFGLQPFGYLASSLFIHFSSGVLFWFLALRLGLERPAAAFAALLSVARPPSLSDIFFISIFSYVLSTFWMLSSVLLALVALRRQERGARVVVAAVSAISTALALLASEIAIVTPGIVAAAVLCDGRLRSERIPWSRVVGHLAPHLLVAIGWCIVRFKLVVLASPGPWYMPTFGLHNFQNAGLLIVYSLGSSLSCIVLTLWLFAPLGIVATQPAIRGRVGKRPLPAAVVGLAWLLPIEAIFAPAYLPQLRFAIAVEVPVCLWIGVGASIAWSCAPRRARAMLGATALLSISATIPYDALWTNWSSPRGDHARDLLGLAEQAPALIDTKIVLLHSGPNMASEDTAISYGYSIWNGVGFMAIHPTRRLTFEIRDASQLSPRAACDRCVFVALRPDQSLEIVSDPASLSSSSPRLPASRQ